MPVLRVPEIVYLAATTQPEPERAWTEQPDSAGLEWLCVDIVGGLDAEGLVSAAALDAQAAEATLKIAMRTPSGSPINLRYYQNEAIAAVFALWKEGKKAPIVILPTGCHRAGQMILMFDGSTKAVEDIEVGDKLHGVDLHPRTVLQLCRGRGRMVEVVPGPSFQKAGRKPWVVNEDHVLTLQHTRYGSAPSGWTLVDRNVAALMAMHPMSSDLFEMVYADPTDPVRRANWMTDSAFRLEPLGTAHEDYFGFTLDEDNRYMLADGTITRNSGKTLVAAEIMRCAHESGLFTRPVFIAHRQELLDQTIAKVKVMAPTRSVGLVQAEHDEPNRHITVASLQTLAGKNGERIKGILNAGAPQLLILDECVPAGTMIGDVPIEQIRVGDMVLSFSEDTGTAVKRRVLQTMRRPAPPGLVRATVENRILVCTHEHPVLTRRMGWIPAHQLVVGDEVRSHVFADMPWRFVETVERCDSESLCPDGHVYNLEVEGTHTYVANGIVVHNCHHATSPSHTRVIAAFREANPALVILGLTATPGRADGTSLDRVFDCIAYQKSIYEMIDEGFLVPPVGVRVMLDINIDTVDSESGDFVTKKLAKIVDQPAVNREVVAAWLKHGKQRRTIAFCITKEHAANIAIEFAAVGVTAEVVNEKTKSSARKAIYQRFRDGITRVICSVEVLTEGFDEPCVECILMARPTQSQTLLIQAVGRGLRLFPMKEDCIVIDCTANSSKYTLAQLANLSGLEPPKPPGVGPPKPPEEEEEGQVTVDGVTTHALDFKMRKREAKFAWREIATFGWALQIPKLGYFLVGWHGSDKTQATVRFHDMRKGKRDLPPNVIVHKPIAFDLAYGLVEGEVQRILEAKSSRARLKDDEMEDEVPDAFAFLEDGLEDDLIINEATLRNDAGWRLRPTTEPQREFLRSLGLKGVMPDTQGEAGDLITVMQIEQDLKKREPATHKQLWYLRSNGVQYPSDITKNAAKKLILTYKTGSKT